MPPGELLDSQDASGHGDTGSGQAQSEGGGILEDCFGMVVRVRLNEIIRGRGGTKGSVDTSFSYKIILSLV